MSMISNSILDDLLMVGCGEGDDARQEDMRAASAAADEIKRLRAREARLRKALKHYAEDCDGRCCNKLHKAYQVCGYIARAALKEEKK